MPTIITQGVVTARTANTPTAVAAGSRSAITSDGRILCTYMLQEKLGLNDFKPVIATSDDQGHTWRDERLLWPHLAEQWSSFGSISANPDGSLMYFGSQCPIAHPRESSWSEANTGLKQNQLIWSRSTDDGNIWLDPQPIAMPIPGAAEAAGALCVTTTGRWIACYAPYNNFDPNVKVPRNQLAQVASDDQGKTWQYQPIMQFPSPTAGCAEAWVVQLADGRLLATAWQFDYEGMRDAPNPYAISHDEGKTWVGPLNTTLQGHTTALTPLPDGRIAMLYVQRRIAPFGVRLAIARPDEKEFNIESDDLIWQAATAREHGGEADHDAWTDFAFGEPSALLLPNGDLFVTLWCIQPNLRGIASVHVQL